MNLCVTVLKNYSIPKSAKSTFEKILNIKRRFDSLNQLRHNLSGCLVFKAQPNIRLEAYGVQLFDVLELPPARTKQG
jgi:hypothetical protein